MSTIYSALIYEGHDLGGVNYVPLDPGFVWVVRDITVFFPGPNAIINVQVVALETEVTFYSISATDVGLHGESHQWTGRQVFVPPEGLPTLSVNAEAVFGGPDVRISGWKLTPP